MFDWLRLFESTAFFVLLMIETLADIKDFMVLIMVSLLMFGLPMTILNNNRGELDSVQDAPIGFWMILIQTLILNDPNFKCASFLFR